MFLFPSKNKFTFLLALNCMWLILENIFNFFSFPIQNTLANELDIYWSSSIKIFSLLRFSSLSIITVNSGSELRLFFIQLQKYIVYRIYTQSSTLTNSSTALRRVVLMNEHRTMNFHTLDTRYELLNLHTAHNVTWYSSSSSSKLGRKATEFSNNHRNTTEWGGEVHVKTALDSLYSSAIEREWARARK